MRGALHEYPHTKLSPSRTYEAKDLSFCVQSMIGMPLLCRRVMLHASVNASCCLGLVFASVLTSKKKEGGPRGFSVRHFA